MSYYDYSKCVFNMSEPEPQATINATDSIKVASGLYAFRFQVDNGHTKCYIGVDEAGRGPLISRVYTGAVILPDPETSGMDFSQIRDSKKLTTKKIHELADYIKTHAIAWAVTWEDERTIDEINILEATQRAMHKAITAVIGQLSLSKEGLAANVHLVVDGNRFNTYSHAGRALPYTTVEGGDNIYSNIAAASILAKSAHDNFIINELCQTDPTLITKYALDQNVGYGSKRHMDGIRAYGISLWHRRSFGICKLYADPTTAPALDVALRETLAQQDAALLAAKAPKVKAPKAPKAPRKTKKAANKEAAILKLTEILNGFIDELMTLGTLMPATDAGSL